MPRACRKSAAARSAAARSTVLLSCTTRRAGGNLPCSAIAGRILGVAVAVTADAAARANPRPFPDDAHAVMSARPGGGQREVAEDHRHREAADAGPLLTHAAAASDPDTEHPEPAQGSNQPRDEC